MSEGEDARSSSSRRKRQADRGMVPALGSIFLSTGALHKSPRNVAAAGADLPLPRPGSPFTSSGEQTAAAAEELRAVTQERLFSDEPFEKASPRLRQTPVSELEARQPAVAGPAASAVAEETLEALRRQLAEWSLLLDSSLERFASVLDQKLADRACEACEARGWHEASPAESAAPAPEPLHTGGSSSCVTFSTEPSHEYVIQTPGNAENCHAEMPRSSQQVAPKKFVSETSSGLSLGNKHTNMKSGMSRQVSFDTHATHKQDWQEDLERRLGQKIAKSTALFGFGSSQKIAAAREAGPPKGKLVDFMNSTAVNSCTVSLILGNTFFIGVESDWAVQAALSGETVPSSFKIVNRFFGAAFLLELLVKLLAFRWWWLVGPDAGWNVFDAFLVASSLFQELMSGWNVSFMRIFRIFRVARVARVIRVVRFFRELRRMVCAIGACLASLCWAFLLLAIIMYVFSIFFVQGAAGELNENPNSPLRPQLLEFYPSLFGTMFSLFLCISGGTDWLTVLAPLMHISDGYRVCFLFYIVFVTFGVLNVLTGVFLESATEFSDKDLVVQAQIMRDNAFILEMNEFYEEFDAGSHGSINWERFCEFLHNEEVYAYLASQQLESQDAYTLFRLLDRDGAGTIDVTEFIDGCLKLKGDARQVDLALVLQQQEKQRETLDQVLLRVKEVSQAVEEVRKDKAHAKRAGQRAAAQ